MRIALSTDCWFPQINGVTLALDATANELRAQGHDVLVLSPDNFGSVSLPYQDSLVLVWYPRLARLLREFKPDTVWIATQGVLGICSRFWCVRQRVHFVMSFHTRFPEYARIRYRIPEGLLYRYARFFFSVPAPMLVPSRDLADDLGRRGVGRPEVWRYGVDLTRFAPRPKSETKYQRPVLLYVGRVAREKNLEAFLGIKCEGTKIIVGDGPLLSSARDAYPDAVFLGELQGDALARCYNEADVFVFPSLLDTFGLVILEALASGVPVAALPSPPLTEIFRPLGVVAINEDLGSAIREAQQIPAERCREAALQFSWESSARQLVKIIEDDRQNRGHSNHRMPASSLPAEPH